MKQGFVKVAAAIPSVKVADCLSNADSHLELIRQADERQVEVLCFPELSLTGCTCGDLFFQRTLADDAAGALQYLLDNTADSPMLCLAGLPIFSDGKLLDVTVAFQSGRLLAAFPCRIPSRGRERWFCPMESESRMLELCGQSVPMGHSLLRSASGLKVAVETGCGQNAEAGAAQLLVLASARPAVGGNLVALHRSLTDLSHRQTCACLYVSPGSGESSTDQVFAGDAFVAECGTPLASTERFSEEGLLVTDIDMQAIDALRMRRPGKPAPFPEAGCVSFGLRDGVDAPADRVPDPLPFVPEDKEILDEIFDIQVAGLVKRMKHTGLPAPVMGISGGLDSTLALLVAVKACDRLGMDRSEVLGVTMPGFGTSDRTYDNALALMRQLGITSREISIREACLQHFEAIGHPAARQDAVYENTQARERTQILMDLANACHGLVVGTGDLSELALGWATYNGDHMSMYSVNASISKTLVRHLVRRAAATQVDQATGQILLDIVDTPVSPELLPADTRGEIAQKTEDLVGPYELHDFFLYYVLRYGFGPEKILYLARLAFADRFEEETIRQWLQVFIRRFFAQQFKRSCLPDGPDATGFSLSPRGAWHMPSDAVCRAWINELN